MGRSKKSFSLWRVILLFLPLAAWPQDFAPIYGNLNRLESLMTESLNLTESTLKDNEDLKAALNNLDELLKTQGELLAEQQKAWEEQREISERQSELLGKYISRSRILTVSLLIGLPLAAGAGILTGVILGRY